MGKRRQVLKGLAAGGLAPIWRPVTLFAAEPLADDRFAAVNTSLVEFHGAPRFRRFYETAATLAAALQGYNAGDVTRDEAVAAFDAALDAWMGCQHLRMGALELKMRDFRVEFWPDKKNRVGKQLNEALTAQRADLLDPAVMADASVALQGFPALERLLFEDPVAPGGYGGKLAAAIGDNLAVIAGNLDVAWASGGTTAELLLNPAPDGSRFAAVKDVAAAFVSALVTQLEFIAERKLAAPLGVSVEKARPRLAESWRSGRSMANVTANLAAMVELYVGPGGHPGLMTLVEQAGFAELAQNIKTLVERAHQTSAGLGPDLDDLLDDEAARAAIETVIDDANGARRLAAGDMAGALGLILGFNSLDGD
jgi:hypothetical protein